MKIIAAKILDLHPHPQVPQLKICQVTTGQEETQVICGANNVRKGMISILALPGSVTPQGQAIQNAILCSANDLNISQETGIIDLPESVPLGVSFEDIPLDFLSSTPWYQFQEVEAFWQERTGRKILIQRDFLHSPDPNDYFLLSKTYFHEGRYLYRHFSGL